MNLYVTELANIVSRSLPTRCENAARIKPSLAPHPRLAVPELGPLCAPLAFFLNREPDSTGYPLHIIGNVWRALKGRQN